MLHIASTAAQQDPRVFALQCVALLVLLVLVIGGMGFAAMAQCQSSDTGLDNGEDV